MLKGFSGVSCKFMKLLEVGNLKKFNKNTYNEQGYKVIIEKFKCNNSDVFNPERTVICMHVKVNPFEIELICEEEGRL